MDYDPTDSRQRDAAAQDARERHERQHQLFVSDLKWLMSDKRGRRIVAALLSRTGETASSFDANAASMAFKEGVRWVGLWLKGEMETNCMDRYVDMLKEQNDARHSRD